MGQWGTLKTPITVQEITDHELYGVYLNSAGEGQPLSSDAIEKKLRAAEDFYERNLGIRLQPTRVFSDPWGRLNGTFPPGNVLDLTDLNPPYDPVNDIAEPAYDYDAGLWSEERWGHIRLRHRPVRDITRVVIAYPGVQPIYEVPRKWIRLEPKFGTLQLVPSSGEAIFATFNSYFIGVLAGGQGLPQSIYIDYVTGFDADELTQYHQDLLEGVRLRALLNILGIATSANAPGGAQSYSLGLDGLSRSQSIGGKYGPYTGTILAALEREQEIRSSWQQQEHGIELMVV